MSRFPLRAATLLAGACLIAALADGQIPDDIRRGQSHELAFPSFQNIAGAPTEVELTLVNRHRTDELSRRLTAAMQAVAEAETDQQRAESERELRETVDLQFDQIVKEREEQISELQARLERLNNQLKERRAAKDEIVDLRVKVLINEAKGLGFYPGENGDDGIRSIRRLGVARPGLFGASSGQAGYGSAEWPIEAGQLPGAVRGR